MQALHLDAEQRYDSIRKSALRAVQNALADNNTSDITLRVIDQAALTASKVWETSAIRRVDWDWLASYPSFRFRHPKRFELAIWQGPRLISLSLGRPTYHGTAMRLDFVESQPVDQGKRPKTFRLVTAALQVYAELLGAREIRIMNPINDAVKQYYTSYGFTYHPKGDFLSKLISEV
ncbi:hypothetical protein R50072_08010 [Simiduia litorea]